MKKRFNFFGLFLVALGIYMLLQQLGYLSLGLGQILSTYWPLILIYFGVRRSVDGAMDPGAMFLVGFGFYFLLKNLNIPFLRNVELWPFLLIGLGLLILFGRKMPKTTVEKWTSDHEPKPSLHTEPRNSDFIRESVFLNQKEVHLVCEDFQGGEIQVSLGSMTLDLREVTLTKDVILQVDVVLGQAEIILPEKYHAVLRGSEMIGSFENHHPKTETQEIHRLLVEYHVTLGSVSFY